MAGLMIGLNDRFACQRILFDAAGAKNDNIIPHWCVDDQCGIIIKSHTRLQTPPYLSQQF